MVRQISFVHINLQISIDIVVKYMVQEGFTIFGCSSRFSFVPSQFGEDAILKDKNVFSSNVFSNVQMSWFFLSKNLIIRAEKKFLNKDIRYAFQSKFAAFSDWTKNPKFWMFWEILLFTSHSAANLLPLAIFEKFKIFFRKTHLFFFKKPKFWTFWEILLSVAFYGKFATIWWKKFQTREQYMLARSRELNWQTSGKKWTYVRGRFCFHILKKITHNNKC